MVDRVQCQSVLDLSHEWFEKLLLGAIDKKLDRKKIEVHDPATDVPDTSSTLSHRFKPDDKGKERQGSDDDTIVGSSRYNSLHSNRTSTMKTLIESPTDDAHLTHHFQERSPDYTTSRYTSPPSAGQGPSRRHTDSIPEAEEAAEPKGPRRSFTFGSQKARYGR